MILVIFFVLLLVISVVSAADNATEDIINVKETTDEIKSVCASDVYETVGVSDNQNDGLIEINNQEKTDLVGVEKTIDEVMNDEDEVENVKELEKNNVMNNQDTIGSSETQDEILLDSNENILSSTSTYPSYSDYSVKFSTNVVKEEYSISISMSISPALNSTYKYYYYLKVYDSNNIEKISQLYYSTTLSYSKTYSIDSYQLSPGTYTIKIINYKDNNVMDTAKLNVKVKTYVDAENICTTYGSSKNLMVTLKDDNGILIGKTVSVKLNGIIYSYITNSNGQIFVKVPNNLAPKTYTASIEFAGDDNYTVSSKNVNVVVEKIMTKITVKSLTGNVGKKVKLTATVKDYFGNNVKGFTVYFKFNGKKYNAKTNSKGIATVKVKVPKSKIFKIYSKTKGKIVTKVTTYKKTYACTASFIENKYYMSSSAKFDVTSKNKKTQKYKIVKRQTKKITIPYKKWGLRKKISGHYVFGIYHEQREVNRITIAAGDKTLRKYIKFSSNAYYINHGKKVYPWKWMKSKHSDDTHEYYYTGDAKIYVIIKYKAYTYKRI